MRNFSDLKARTGVQTASPQPRYSREQSMMKAETMLHFSERDQQPAPSMPPKEDIYWKAIRDRDPSFDGLFFYSVATTGIYCRPSCPARLARRENVAFHTSCKDAEIAGFRPCKRCRPTEPSLHDRYAAKVAEACRVIETADEPPTLEELALKVSLSPYHFHRVFKAVAGMTPKAYAVAHRQKLIRQRLRTSASVTEAIHDAGFNSMGRFYADATEVLGMTPTEFRAGGSNAEMRFAVGECSLGSILVASSDKGVTAILLGDDPEMLVHDLEDRFPNAKLIGGDRDYEDIMAKIVGLVEAPDKGLDLPLDVRGTAFQHRVWQAIREIPAGTTATYAEIAERIGMPKAVRAVAAACAANKIAIAIPCHRVVRTDGSLAGYRWGIDRKRELIAREVRS